jgi:hypothetical protein
MPRVPTIYLDLDFLDLDFVLYPDRQFLSNTHWLRRLTQIRTLCRDMRF